MDEGDAEEKNRDEPQVNDEFICNFARMHICAILSCTIKFVQSVSDVFRIRVHRLAKSRPTDGIVYVRF